MSNPELRHAEILKKLKSRWRELKKYYGIPAILGFMFSLVPPDYLNPAGEVHPTKIKNPIVVSTNLSAAEEIDPEQQLSLVRFEDKQDAKRDSDTIGVVKRKRKEEAEADAEALTLRPEPVASVAYIGETEEPPEWFSASAETRIAGLLETAPHVFLLDPDLLDEFLDTFEWREAPDEVPDGDLNIFDYPIMVYLAGDETE